ncbi:MAG: polyprenyl diphosphate synthase [Gemmatimonadetes bacterium]|nr:polyprenyl diphosphate synthase [Gemmatimonadota bacterium]
MDGNGRWAEIRGRPRTEGHVAGADAVRRTVRCAPRMGIATLTLYAFSSDNWRRPAVEVAHLMRLFEEHLESERGPLTERGVRLSVIGRRDRLPASLTRTIASVEAQTRDGTTLDLRIAMDYSARYALLAAAGRVAEGIPPAWEAFERSIYEVSHAPPGPRDVDLLIRTGGERRLSDFLLWESAYAELFFTEILWPDFGEAELAAAVEEYGRRDRRYGGISRTPRAAVGPELVGRRAAR